MSVSTSRQRFVDVAAHLFAERGFAATSVADIQTALGLTAGSGALYKHFPSKRVLLAEVVGIHLATMRSGHAEFEARVPADLEQALGYVADSVWAGMQRDHSVLRVLVRDLDAHPDLLDEVCRGNVYHVFTAWLRSQADAGTIAVDGPGGDRGSAARLADLLADPGLSHRSHPGDVDATRFRTAWVRHALATLRLTSE